MSPSRRSKPTALQLGLFGLGVMVMVVALAALALSFWVGGYLRSEDFRRLLGGHAGRALGGEAELAPLRWEGSGVYCEFLRFRGREEAALAFFEARHLRAGFDWKTVFTGIWRAGVIEALDMEAALAGLYTAPSQEKRTPPSLSSQPFKVHWESFQALRASLDLGNGAAFSGCQLRVEPVEGGWAFQVSGGRFVAAGWPEILLDELRARMSRGGNFYLSSARGHFEEGGEIYASGDFGETSSLHLRWEGVPSEVLLPSRWRERLEGRLSGNATGTFRSGKAHWVGRVLLTEGRLRELPVLEKIAAFTGVPQFRRMPLQELSMDFENQDGGWEYKNVVVESRGLLRAAGNLKAAADGTLDGRLEVGVAPQALQWLPGSRERVFTRNEDGYLWTPVRVSGTIGAPEEDLSRRLSAAARQELLETGARMLEKPAEAARGLLDALAPILP